MASKAATAAVVRPSPRFAVNSVTVILTHQKRSRTSPASIQPLVSEMVFILFFLSPLPLIKNSKLICSFPRHLSETVAALQAFRKRHSDAQRISGQLHAQPTTVDLAHYRSVLKNKAIVDEAEKILRDFKPVVYDVKSHIKAIETFETKAVRISFYCPSRLLISTTLLDTHTHKTNLLFLSCCRIQIAKAKETEAKIDIELKDLQATLSNIQDARPFEDLTVRHSCAYSELT
jgi:hypothetical protein